MMFCSNCGLNIQGKYCASCGHATARSFSDNMTSLSGRDRPANPAQNVAPSLPVGIPRLALRKYTHRRPEVVAIASGGAVFILGLAIVGGNPLAAAEGGHPLKGTFTVKGFGSLDAQGDTAQASIDKLNNIISGTTYDCSSGPGGGYSDIAAGTSVTVSDGSGKVLATGNLAGGIQSASGCTFTFQAQLPNSAFYKLEVGNRGAQSYSQEELSNKGWQVALTLG